MWPVNIGHMTCASEQISIRRMPGFRLYRRCACLPSGFMEHKSEVWWASSVRDKRKLSQHGNRKSAVCCCCVLHVLLSRYKWLHSWPGTVMNLKIECMSLLELLCVWNTGHWFLPQSPGVEIYFVFSAGHCMYLPSCADRPPDVRGAAAVGERCRGAGEHLQDPASNFHP